MWFCEKSHLGPTVQFSEYQGFNHTSLGKSGHFIQFEVLEEDTQDYEKVPVRAKPGDVVVVRISAYGDRKLNPMGSIERVLGPVSEPGVDVLFRTQLSF